MLGLTSAQMRNYEGYLEKKEAKTIALFKKRFFKIIDAQILIYFEHQNNQTFKGYYKISEISEPMPTDEKHFLFKYNEHNLEFRANSYQERERWIYSISHCREFLKNNQAMSKNLAYILRENGLLGVEETRQNKLILNSLGFGNNLRFVRLNQEKFKMRFFSKFVYDNISGKQKRRFLILFSRRPLSNRDYIFEKELDSEFYERSPKDWLKYETIYLFHYDKIKESYKTSLRNEINLSQVNTVYVMDKYEKHIYLNNAKHNIICDISLETKEERDELFEYLSNSFRTAKLMLKSKTGKPKNVAFLNYLYNQNETNELKSFIEDETKKIAINKQNKNFQDINTFNNNFKNAVMPIIDGCLSHNPQYIKVLNYYLSELNLFFYKELQMFLEEHKDTINIQEIVILSMQLKTWSSILLNSYNICDYDLEKNINKFIKIYIKENYITNMKYIKELINKSLIDDCSTSKELITLITKALQIFQVFVHKYTYEKLTILIHDCIVQYLLGIDMIISDYNKELNDNALIKIINNLAIIKTKINTLIANLSENGILNQREILNLFQLNSIINNFNLALRNSLFRLIYNNIHKVEKIFYSNEGIDKINVTESLTDMIEKDLAHIYRNLHDYNQKQFITHLLYWLIGYSLKMILNANNYYNNKNINKKIGEYIQNIHNAFRKYIVLFPQNTLTVIEEISDILNIIISKTFENDHSKQLKEKIQSLAIHFDHSLLTSLINIITEIAGFTNEKKLELINDIKSDCFQNKQNEFNLIFWTIWNTDSKNKNPFLTSVFDHISQEYQLLYNPKYQETTILIKDISIFKEGFLKTKFMNKWRRFYVQLKPTQLLIFKDSSCKELFETIQLSNVLYYHNYKKNHFLLLLKYIYKKESETFIRKYYSESHEEIIEWLQCIKECIKNIKSDNKVIVINGNIKLIEEKVGMDETFIERNSIRNICLNQEESSLNLVDNQEKNDNNFSKNINEFRNKTWKNAFINNYVNQKDNPYEKENNSTKVEGLKENDNSNKYIIIENNNISKIIDNNEFKRKEIKEFQIHTEEQQFNLSQPSQNQVIEQLPETEHLQNEQKIIIDSNNENISINSIQQNSIMGNEFFSQPNNDTIQTVHLEIEQQINNNEDSDDNNDKGLFNCFKCLFFLRNK